MNHCFNPDCSNPSQNEIHDQFCKACGTRLRLQDRYRAIKPIGRGGFGITYLAIDEGKPSQPQCVIKQFNFQGPGNVAKAIKLFQQEAVRLEQLGHHDQIPTLYTRCEQDRRHYIVQEYIEGQNLAQELKQRGSFSESQVRQLLLDLLPLLRFIHQGQVIHRDIKPENIIRKPGGQLVLVDFGAAKYAAGLTLTKTGTVIGSAEYSAPEQAGGKATFASDLYSLGVTCLVLLTCTSPFELYSYADMGWKWQQYLRGQSISTELTEVLNRLVAPGLNYRFQTADQVLEALSHPSKPPSGPILPDQPYQPVHSILHLQRFQFHVIWVNHYGREINRELKETGYFIESFPGFHMEMVGIPEGTLAFPIDGGNHGQSSQGIMLAPFYMGKYPIHQGQWRTVAALPRINQELPPNPSYFRGEKRPVESISWFEAVEFCQRLSQKTGRGYRLPTDTEWEYACRAGTMTPFHFGVTLTPDLANYDGHYAYGEGPVGRYLQRTTDVGSYPANGFGLYDLHGNVWEWCADQWYEYYLRQPMDGRPSLSETGTQGRMLRGGSWLSSPAHCRSSYRYYHNPDHRYKSYGFRVVCSPSKSI